MTLEELVAKQERLIAVIACKKLMANYFDGRLWAKLPSTSVELPWGAYDGFEGFIKCYRDDHDYNMDREGNPTGDVEAVWDLPGVMCQHTYSTPVIEVAEDGMTARGVWLSAGTENYGIGDQITNEQDRGFSGWAWTKYSFDFIKIDGKWKIWHYCLFGLFLTRFEDCWTETRPYDGFSLITTNEDRPPVHMPYDWSIDSVYPWNCPDPPKPYKCFEDVAPGYGYLDDEGGPIESVIKNVRSPYEKK